MCVHKHASARRDQKRVLDPPKLELQAAVSQSQFSGRAASALQCWAVFPTLCILCVYPVGHWASESSCSCLAGIGTVSTNKSSHLSGKHFWLTHLSSLHLQFFKRFKSHFYRIYGCLACTVFAPHVCSTLGGQERMSDPLKLGLGLLVSCHAGPGTWTQRLQKRSRCFWPLSHFSKVSFQILARVWDSGEVVEQATLTLFWRTQYRNV